VDSITDPRTGPRSLRSPTDARLGVVVGVTSNGNAGPDRGIPTILTGREHVLQ
jgi:hypothetical protein